MQNVKISITGICLFLHWEREIGVTGSGILVAGNGKHFYKLRSISVLNAQ